MMIAAPAIRNDIARLAKPEPMRVTVVLDEELGAQVRTLAMAMDSKIAPLLRKWISERVRREIRKAHKSAHLT